ncbi:MAG: hypothetical protein IJS54_04070 [Desulfovibrio sp.]|nr:hypothetical protein [Desulfovibrio sp.]
MFVNNENTVFDYEYNNCFGTGNKNIFKGKPVECLFTHQGRYLWVSYYRRECDPNASSPSAVAIIDTNTDTIVRVMPTAPLPKMLAASPDGKWVAVTNWGDNTIGLINIEGDDPRAFSYTRQIVVGHKLPVRNLSGNRDSACGLCLRGTVFTKDSQHLFVLGMRSDRLFVYTSAGDFVGSVRLPVPNPRHCVLSPDGKNLYVSFNVPGKVAKIAVAAILDMAPTKGKVSGSLLHVGAGARTIALSNDGARLYAVSNSASHLSCVDIARWKVVAQIPVAPYGVGLALHPLETIALVTSQGKNGQGGNTVGVFRIEGVHTKPE